MGMYPQLLDTDNEYRQITGETVIINDLSNETEAEREEVNALLYTTNGDVYNNVPTCRCGNTTGKYKIGTTCRTCHTKVEEVTAKNLQSYIWIRAPKGVKSLFNVTIFLMLRNYFVKDDGKFDVIQYITNPHYRPMSVSKDSQSIQEKIEKHPVLNKRSFNFFLEHFDEWMVFLFSQPEYKKVKDRQRGNDVPPLFKLIQDNKDILFPQYIPVPNKTLLVVEDTAVLKYIDNSLVDAISGIRMLIGIDNPTTSVYAISNKSRESRVARCLTHLTDHYRTFYSDTIGGKSGIARRLMLGTRCDYSFRTVITSITGPHQYDEIHIPWAVAMVVLRMHIINKLRAKYKWTPVKITQFLVRYTRTYHPILDEIFKELIAEAGGKIYALMNRNPSMGRASLQRVGITKVKTDTTDNTTSISILIVRGFNADFDGDALNYVLLLDEWAANEALLMAPAMNIYDLTSLYKPSNVTHLPNPVAMNIANWLDETPQAPTAEQIKAMADLAA